MDGKVQRAGDEARDPGRRFASSDGHLLRLPTVGGRQDAPPLRLFDPRPRRSGVNGRARSGGLLRSSRPGQQPAWAAHSPEPGGASVLYPCDETLEDARSPPASSPRVRPARQPRRWPRRRSPRPRTSTREPRIVTPGEVTTEAELATRGERALMEQRWQEAADAYRTLVAATPSGPHAAEYLFDLGLALEGMQQRAAGARRVPRPGAPLPGRREGAGCPRARGDARRVPRGLEGAGGHRRSAAGARRTSTTSTASWRSARAAWRASSWGTTARRRRTSSTASSSPTSSTTARATCCRWPSPSYGSPWASCAASAPRRITFDPAPPPDFSTKLEERAAGCSKRRRRTPWRCARSTRTGRRWPATASARCTARCTATSCRSRRPPRSKTEKQKQMFFAFMHIRYRILLEKGLREMEQTVALGERTSDSSPWIQRARDAQRGDGRGAGRREGADRQDAVHRGRGARRPRSAQEEDRRRRRRTEPSRRRPARQGREATPRLTHCRIAASSGAPSGVRPQERCVCAPLRSTQASLQNCRDLRMLRRVHNL